MSLKREFSTANFEKFFRITLFRRSHRRFSFKKLFLKNFARFTAHQACNFIIKDHQHRRFSTNNAKYFRTPTLKNVCERLLLTLTEQLWTAGFYSNRIQKYSKYNKKVFFWLMCLEKHEHILTHIKDHPFSTFVKFSGKLTFLTPWYAHVRNTIGNTIIHT